MAGTRPQNVKIHTEAGSRYGHLPPVETGASTTYLPDPAILRQIREIDPNLDLEWRPNGQWWTSPVHGGGTRVPSGATPGCWRLVLVGGSGERRGIMLWPPKLDGRLVAYLYRTWAFERFVERSTIMSPAQKHWAKRAGHRAFDQQRADEKRQKWEAIDHGEMHRAVKAAHADPKWRGGWSVPAKIGGN